jgi:hypothetical protein
MNLLINTIILLMVLGFPRIPNTDIPIFLVLVPFYYKSILLIFQSKLIKKIILWAIISFLYGLLIWLINESSKLEDLKFLFVIFIKLLLTIIGALIVVKSTLKTSNAILFWIISQSILIVLSIIDQNFYNFLVNFSGKSGYGVYSTIGNLRGIGFGITHVYGVYTAVTFIVYYLAFLNKNYIKSIFVYTSILIMLTLSRTGVVLAAIYLIISKRKYILPAVFIYISLSLLYIEEIIGGAHLQQVLEIGINTIEFGNAFTQSTNANMEMLFFPDDLSSWIFGSGKFFENGNFYKDTDIGYLRILNYGGLGFLFLFFALNIYPLLEIIRQIKADEKNYNLNKFIIFIILSFIIVNLKGLIDIGIVSYIILIKLIYLNARK